MCYYDYYNCGCCDCLFVRSLMKCYHYCYWFNFAKIKRETEKKFIIEQNTSDAFSFIMCVFTNLYTGLAFFFSSLICYVIKSINLVSFLYFCLSTWKWFHVKWKMKPACYRPRHCNEANHFQVKRFINGMQSIIFFFHFVYVKGQICKNELMFAPIASLTCCNLCENFQYFHFHAAFVGSSIYGPIICIQCWKRKSAEKRQ